MSVLLRDNTTGKVLVYAKGAESTIVKSLSSESVRSPITSQVLHEVERFGSKGLRTLVFAMREMPQEEF